jgi:hypothetical protein
MVYILSWIDVYGKMFRTSTIYNKRTKRVFGVSQKNGPSDPLTTPPLALFLVSGLVQSEKLSVQPALASLPNLLVNLSRPWNHHGMGQGPGAVGQQGQRWDRHSMASGFAPSIPGVVLLGMTPQRPCGILTSSFTATMDEYLPSRDHFSISFVGAGILLQ